MYILGLELWETRSRRLVHPGAVFYRTHHWHRQVWAEWICHVATAVEVDGLGLISRGTALGLEDHSSGPVLSCKINPGQLSEGLELEAIGIEPRKTDNITIEAAAELYLSAMSSFSGDVPRPRLR